MTGETNQSDAQKEDASEFEKASIQGQQPFFRELFDFLIHHAAWWITPIVIVLVLLGALLLLGSSAVAPFIYPLF